MVNIVSDENMATEYVKDGIKDLDSVIKNLFVAQTYFSESILSQKAKVKVDESKFKIERIKFELEQILQK